MDPVALVLGIICTIGGSVALMAGFVDVFRPLDARSRLDGYGPVFGVVGLAVAFLGMLLGSLGLGWGGS